MKALKLATLDSPDYEEKLQENEMLGHTTLGHYFGIRVEEQGTKYRIRARFLGETPDGEEYTSMTIFPDVDHGILMTVTHVYAQLGIDTEPEKDPPPARLDGWFPPESVFSMSKERMKYWE